MIVAIYALDELTGTSTALAPLFGTGALLASLYCRPRVTLAIAALAIVLSFERVLVANDELSGRQDGIRILTVVITGAVAYLVSVLRARLERALAASQLLAGVGRSLAEAPDARTGLRAVAPLLVPRLADWAAVDVASGDRIDRVAVAPADADEAALAEAAGPAAAEQAIRTGERQLLEHAAVLPLKGRAGTYGALTLVTAESGRRLTEPELALAGEVARRCALGLENAALLEHRRMAAEQLGEAFALLNVIFERVPIGLAFFDRDLRYVRVNGRLAEINGVPSEDHIGRPIGDVLPDISGDVEAALRRVLETGEPLLDVEVAGETPAQPETRREWQVSYWPVTRDGEIIGLGSVVQETTERRAAERALREQTDRYETLLLALSEVGEGMVVLEGDHVVYANQAFQTLSGYGFDELIAMDSAFDVVVPEQRELARARTRQPTVDDQAVDPHFELRLRHRDGRVLDVEVAGVPLFIGDRQQLVVVLRDITARRRAEDERRRLFELERIARAEAERAHASVSFLAELGAALEQSLDVASTIERAARVIVREHATTCVAVLGPLGPELQRLPAVARDSETEALLREIQARHPLQIGPDQPVGMALRTGALVRLDEVSEETLQAAAEDSEHLEKLRALGFSGAFFLPLVARGRVLGVLVTGFAEPVAGARGDELQALLEQAAARIALAVDNTRLYEERSHVARTLQQSLLPPELPLVPGVELAARYRAAGEGNEVGGDFYDCFALGGGEWALVIGDVCGKGPEAAAVTALARYTIRASVLHDRRPRAVLAELNEAIRRQQLEYRFATVLYASVKPDIDIVRIRLAVGGHPLPLIVRADGTVEPAGRPGTLLGVLPDPKLPEDDVELHPGDAMVLYTDGVIEASPVDDVFGVEQLAELLSGCARQEAADIAATVERAVVDVQQGRARDDVALLVVRVPEPATSFGSRAQGVSATA